MSSGVGGVGEPSKIQGMGKEEIPLTPLASGESAEGANPMNAITRAFAQYAETPEQLEQAEQASAAFLMQIFRSMSTHVENLRRNTAALKQIDER